MPLNPAPTGIRMNPEHEDVISLTALAGDLVSEAREQVVDDRGVRPCVVAVGAALGVCSVALAVLVARRLRW